jgi:hypothetical protein
MVVRPLFSQALSLSYIPVVLIRQRHFFPKERGQPVLSALPQAAWIDKPKEETNDGPSSLNSEGQLSQSH